MGWVVSQAAARSATETRADPARNKRGDIEAVPSKGRSQPSPRTIPPLPVPSICDAHRGRWVESARHAAPARAGLTPAGRLRSLVDPVMLPGVNRLALTLAVLCATGSAAAQDTWTTPLPGVRRLRRVTSSQHINALVVNLCAPGISFRVTAPGERTRTVPSFGALVGAQAAVNGGFYNTRDQSMTDGFVLHNGMSWGGTDHDYTGPVAFGDNRVELVPHELVQGPQPWMREAVSGHPTLVHNGATRDNQGDTALCPRHPRTAVGLSQDHRTLILAVVDGRAPGRVGMTCAELAALMRELGAHDALNLDGGGSATMWLAGTGVLNYPSDGTPRTVSNHLALYARGTGAAPHCPVARFRAQYVMQTFPLARTTLDLAPGETFAGYLEMRNTGTETWTPARTRLGTTEPRDRMSAVVGPGWLAPHRPAAIDRMVPPGATGRFNFTLRAPNTPGEYSEYFNLVEEGVAWFSDPTLGGGPADNVIQVRVRTVPTAVADAGVTDVPVALDVPAPQDVLSADGTLEAEVPTPDLPRATDAGAVEDAASPNDAGALADATDDLGPRDEGDDTPLQGGCACRAQAPAAVKLPWSLALLAACIRRRRR